MFADSSCCNVCVTGQYLLLSYQQEQCTWVLQARYTKGCSHMSLHFQLKTPSRRRLRPPRPARSSAYDWPTPPATTGRSKSWLMGKVKVLDWSQWSQKVMFYLCTLDTSLQNLTSWFSRWCACYLIASEEVNILAILLVRSVSETIINPKTIFKHLNVLHVIVLVGQRWGMVRVPRVKRGKAPGPSNNSRFDWGGRRFSLVSSFWWLVKDS